MKGPLAAILAIALLVDLALFFGIGFATGGLSTTGAPPLQSHNDGNACFNFQVSWITPTSYGTTAFASNWVQGGLSTPISLQVSLQVTPGNACASYTGIYGTGWTAGASNQGAYVTLVVATAGGTPEKFNASSNGAGQSVISFSMNKTSAPGVVCASGGCSIQNGGTTAPVSETIGIATVAVSGSVEDFSILRADFHTTFINIGVNGGSVATDSYNEQYFRTGGAIFSSVPQVAFASQGKFTVGVTTYFDAGSGFDVQFLYPATRGSGLIAQQNVPDSKTNYQVTFAIPANASVVSSSISNIEFQLVIYAPAAQEAYQPTFIDISPAYAPPAPNLGYTDLSGHNPAQAGDSLNVNFSATGNNTTGSITQFIVWAYYLLPGLTATGLPPSGSPAWISTGGQQGQVISASQNGKRGTGSFPIVISQAYAIDVQVQAGTSNGQAAVSAANLVIQVLPPGCQATNTCQTGGVVNPLWMSLGPVLLSAAIIIGLALLALLVPVALIVKVVIVASGVILVGVFYALNIWAVISGGAL